MKIKEYVISEYVAQNMPDLVRSTHDDNFIIWANKSTYDKVCFYSIASDTFVITNACELLNNINKTTLKLKKLKKLRKLGVRFYSEKFMELFSED